MYRRFSKCDMFIFIYSDKQTDRQAARQTDRQTDRQIGTTDMTDTTDRQNRLLFR